MENDSESIDSDYCLNDDETEEDCDEEWIDSDYMNVNEDVDHQNDMVLDLPLYYNTHVANLIMPIVPPLPYSEIDFSLLTVDPWSKPSCTSIWDPSKEFAVGMIFPFRDSIQKAAKEYHLLKHHDFCTDETKGITYAIRYKDRKSNCMWRISASRREGRDI